MVELVRACVVVDPAAVVSPNHQTSVAYQDTEDSHPTEDHAFRVQTVTEQTHEDQMATNALQVQLESVYPHDFGFSLAEELQDQ